MGARRVVVRRAWRFVTVMLVAWSGAAPAWAGEQSTERITDVASLEHAIGRVKVRASGKPTGSVQRLKLGAEVRELRQSPYFLWMEGRFDHEARQPYNLRRWGGEFGVGRELTESTDVLTTYRLDGYKVYGTGASDDPAFRTLAGRSDVSALELALLHDSRDDKFYATTGAKARLAGELAVDGLGGDYSFGRLDAEGACYLTPFKQAEGSTGAWYEEITFVDRLRVGWVAPFGDTDRVPFFERYFVGTASTVRGHRGRYLTPHGFEDEPVGGEIQLVNNFEARVPLFPGHFNRQLSTAVFFDAGRAYQRWSEVGNFGYALGAGLRYVVHWGFIHGVARLDYAVNLHHEEDDAHSNLHATFGMPF